MYYNLIYILYAPLFAQKKIILVEVGVTPARAGLGRMGQNLKKIPFQIKIKFLNIRSLWKFAQGDLGGILT
jgi:hypothetical protein